MNPIDYYLDLLGRPLDLLTLVPLLGILCIYSRVWIGRLLNGMILVNVSTAIVLWIALDLYRTGTASASAFLFVLVVEASVYLLSIYLYTYTTRVLRRINPRDLAGSFLKHRYWVYAVFAAQIALQLAFVSWDGSSRIAYQTASWYSPIRVILQLITPAAALVMFSLVVTRKKSVSATIFFLIVAASITSGSKSGFVFTVITGYLLYRDIYGPIALSRSRKLAIAGLVLLLSLANLAALGVDAFKVGERVTHYAEATIMLLPADEPTMACSNNSVVSKLHRGVGRLIGDASSMNVDQLFGFALSAEVYGENSFTGPNARIGAYALCNFGSTDIPLLLIAYGTCVFFCFFSLHISRRVDRFFALAVGLLIVHLSQHLLMDYNTAMSDLTGLAIVCSALVIRRYLIYARNPDASWHFKHV